MIITIDGPAASGKSTSAKLLADKLKFLYLDTGAMYRCIALSVIKNQIDIHNEQSLGDFMKKFKLELITNDGVSGYLVNGNNVSKEIRNSFVSKKVSEISAIPVIREYMVKKQRDFAKNTNCVVEGRDIGTVVFPEAAIKFFMIASVEVRAKRRQLDLQKIGEEVAFEDLKEDAYLLFDKKVIEDFDEFSIVDKLSGDNSLSFELSPIMVSYCEKEEYLPKTCSPKSIANRKDRFQKILLLLTRSNLCVHNI